jgi:D-alanyl-D-alanine endopeptidase (penicillin-binding protein 7)
LANRQFSSMARWLVTVAIAVAVSISAVPVAAAGAASGQTVRGKGTSASKARTTKVRQVSSSKKTPKRANVRAASASKRTYQGRTARRSSSRARARARELAEAQTPRLKTDGEGHEIPAIRAEAAIIYNPATNEVLFEENSQTQRSIASITKVMTALVYLETRPDLTQDVVVERSDVARASTTYLRAGYKVTPEDLLHLLLIGSDNAAARALARVSTFGSAGFIDRMNDKAAELGLTETHYADPSGLLADNVSSAYDMARLIAYAAADDRIGGIMRKAHHTVQSGRRTINVNSTNQLVKSGDIEVVGGKTGFISRSGYCLATLLKLPQTGQQVAVVVLGARSNAGRFWETRHLFNWLSARTQTVLTAQQVQDQDQQ